MTTAVQLRRGTTAETATFTGLEGETTVDTTKDTLVVHNGSTAGGFPIAREDLANVSSTNLPSITGNATAADDTFLIYDQSALTLKKITRAELNNAIEQDPLSNVQIVSGTINGTTIGGTTAAGGSFTTLTSNSTTTLNGTTVPASKTLVTTVDTQTLTNKTLTSPAITTPTGIVKGDVGLGNVDNTSDATKNSATATLTNKTLVAPALGTPASGVVTNLTGTASININGTVGATTASTGAFTNLSASGTLGVTGAGTIQGLTVGRGAGAQSTNTAVGASALAANTTGTSNTANGQGALQNNTTGSNNTANGVNALLNNTTGSANTANGFEALLLNTTGVNNTANGRDALRNNTTGNENTANGKDALRNNTTGGSNTANGTFALFDNSTGSNNTANGFRALQNNFTGSNNIGIGLNAGRSTSPRTITTASNEICIGNNDHTGAFIRIAFTVTSDARDKAALAPIPHGLDFVNALQPTEYQFKAGGRDGEADGHRRYGFLAQDVLAAEGDNPVIVNNDDPDSLKMTHDYLIPVLVKAIQEQQAIIDSLKARLDAANL